MYKFTNGVVVFDEITKDKYVKAGMTLVKEEKPIEKEEKDLVENNVRSKVDSTGFRGTVKQSSKFNRRPK